MHNSIFLICQVRVRIIEGRQLAGANISPVVRVNIDNQTRQTKVIKSTNKPFYDEVCGTQNYIHKVYSVSSQCVINKNCFEIQLVVRDIRHIDDDILKLI